MMCLNLPKVREEVVLCFLSVPGTCSVSCPLCHLQQHEPEDLSVIAFSLQGEFLVGSGAGKSAWPRCKRE